MKTIFDSCSGLQHKQATKQTNTQVLKPESFDCIPPTRVANVTPATSKYSYVGDF